jgi:hypothetical protein
MTPAANRRWFRYALWATFVLAGIVVLILGFVVVVLLAFPEGPRGPVEDRAEWPKPLQDLLAKASGCQIDAEPVRIYCIQDFTERYYYWRMNASPQLIALMVSEWKLRPGTQTDVDRFWKRWPSDWETANTQGDQKCLANAGKPSDNFVVIVDGSRPFVYGFYWFNF